MNKTLLQFITIVFFLLSFQTQAISEKKGEIVGQLILDDSWERKIYLSQINAFEKEYTVANDLVVKSAEIDSMGQFKIDLSHLTSDWSLLRLHIAKKGISANSLVIGSLDENFMLLIANKDSEIQIYNTEERPIFKDVSIEGADYMQTFNTVKNLAEYPNTIDYDSSLIERNFIEDVVYEKLKVIADTTGHPLVSLYALFKTDFQTDYQVDQSYYENYLNKWKDEENAYLEAFRLQFPKKVQSSSTDHTSSYLIVIMLLGFLMLLGAYYYISSRKTDLKTLSIKEREVFDMLRKGMSNKEISMECNIELTTVKSHVGSIYSKLKVKSRKEAMDLKTK